MANTEGVTYARAVLQCMRTKEYLAEYVRLHGTPKEYAFALKCLARDYKELAENGYANHR